MTEIFLLSMLFGAIAGILAGLFGIGGGVILVPFLIGLFDHQGFAAESIMLLAIATSLATIIVTSVASVMAHHRLGNVLWKPVRYLAPGVFVGAVLGALIADFMPSETLKVMFALYLLYVAGQMALSVKLRPGHWNLSYLWLGMAGCVVGVMSAILGIGGGTLTVPLLNKCDFPMRHAIAVSSACGLPIAVAGTMSYALLGWNATGLPVGSVGYVYLPAFLGIISMSIMTTSIGARLAKNLPTQQIKRYFSILLFVVSLKLLF